MALPDLQGELWAWVQSLPPWQSDLLRRLTSLEEVTQTALDEAVGMVLTAFGLPPATPIVPAPIPAMVAPSTRRATQILALSEFVAVASVEAGQRLEFGPTGLTIVFGETGSGKSSYARVLRKACRSSAKPVEILPNVLKSSGNAASARAGTAKIEVSIDGTASVIQRDVNASPAPQLADVSVFDTDCANVYADGESEITYTPSSLRLLERLVGLQTQIRRRIDEEMAALSAEKVTAEGFSSSTKAGALVAALTENVSPATIDALANVSDAERGRLEELRGQLATANARDLTSVATQLEKRARSVDDLAREIQAIASSLDQRVVSELLGLNARAEGLRAQSTELSAALSTAKGYEVGGNSWKVLWQAAHAYMAQTGAKEAVFPPHEAGALCPLCQQVLGDDAIARFARFEEFFRGEVEAEIRGLTAKRGALVATIAKVPDLTKTHGQTAHLAIEQKTIEDAVASFLTSAAARAVAIQASATATKIDAPTMTVAPTTELVALADDLRRQAKEHRALADADAVAKLAREIAELEDRLRLAQRRDAILARIATLQRIAKLKGAASAMSTTGLSRKISEFTESAVTAQLRSRLAVELEALRCTHLPVAIGARGSKGKTIVALQLDATRPVDVGDVLSEGERRAVALSFFLAEVAVAENGGGIVLDDPVSSLDHARRSYVAQRLVEEAKRRQVIVFTHDIVFLLELQELAARAAIDCEARVVLRVGNTAGIAKKDLPWIAQNVGRRIGHLRGEIQRLAAVERKGEAEVYRREAKTWFELLREAWERAVEEHVFYGVVGRFQPGIQTQRLAKVTITPEIKKAVDDGMTRASLWTHDQAPALGKPAPTNTDLQSALDELDKFVAQFKGR